MEVQEDEIQGIPESCPMEVLQTVCDGLVKLHKHHCKGKKVHAQVCSNYPKIEIKWSKLL